METYIKKIRRTREDALVREIERAAPKDNYIQEENPLVREVEDQCIPCYGSDMFNAKAKGATCWIRDGRWFNDHKQLVEHIQGSGHGSKKHLKYRRRWEEAGKPHRDDWLQILKEAKDAQTAAASGIGYQPHVPLCIVSGLL